MPRYTIFEQFEPVLVLSTPPHFRLDIREWGHIEAKNSSDALDLAKSRGARAPLVKARPADVARHSTLEI